MQMYVRALLLSISLLLPALANALTPYTEGENVDLSKYGRLFEARDAHFPVSSEELDRWLLSQKTLESVDLFGGSYWFYAEVSNNSGHDQWIVSADGTLIESVEVRVFANQLKPQHFTSGYNAEHDYMMHYGKSVQLPSNTTAKILIRFESRYFASHPKFELIQETHYQQRIAWENVLILAALGALLTLALYNLFIFTITRENTFVFYATYLIAYFLGWAFTFHIPMELFGWRTLELHYIPFFLLPVLNTLFYVEFLQLKENFPRLAAISKVNLILPLILLPSCFFALSYAHLLATLVITFWLVVALVSGIASWRSGFKPARYFVFAFIALSIPGAVILPANVGLIPDLVRNSELLTLLGGTLDAILLAFALADKIRMLSNDKDKALQHANEMLKLASTDHLTGIPNRHSFDQVFEASFIRSKEGDENAELMMVLIDVDGLKRINDNYGHVRGDELLCSFATDLGSIDIQGSSAYRLGGDEFIILASRSNESELQAIMKEFEMNMHERGFDEAGISFGIAFESECEAAHDMIVRADLRMYAFKSANRRARVQDRLSEDTISQSRL